MGFTVRIAMEYRGTASTLSVVLLVLLGIIGEGKTLNVGEFYPFGKHTGDSRLRGGAEGVHTWVNLSTPVVFYGETHKGLYVNLDGVISFDRPASPFTKHVASRKSEHFPAHFKMLAPFRTHIDTNGVRGTVFFRETQKKTLLLRATKDVRTGFANENRFQGTSVFVATWFKVRYHEQRKKLTNSFQTVLVSDGKKTFALFHYDKPVTQRRAKSQNAQIGLRQPYAKAGFSFGDELREFRLPGSGTRDVHLLSRFTNTNRPGKWLYMIGSHQAPGLNIVSAIRHLPQDKQENNQHMTGHRGCYLMANLTSYGDLTRRNVKTYQECNKECGQTGFTLALFHHIDGCICAEEEILRGSFNQWNMLGKCEGKHLFAVYRIDDVMMGDEGAQEYLINPNECGYDRIKCSENAVCVKSPSYCCVCKHGYYGNGKTCLPDGKGVHMIGKLTGKINDIVIKDLKLSFYGDILSRTSYASLDAVSPSVGWPLRAMMPMVTTPGFLFALPDTSPSNNGISMLGSIFLRRAVVTFETGESCNIREKYLGTDENGFLIFKTEISGNVPNFDESTAIAFDDYIHSYRYDRLGVLSGFYSSSFNAGNRKYQINVVEALEFDEDRGCLNIVDSKMAVSGQRSLFEKENKILRFVQKTEMVDNEVKLCGQMNKQCDSHAKCIVKEGVEFCDCNFGFTGDGYTCQDVEECLLSIHECSLNAKCLNTAGSYSCTCRKGYQGDGRDCHLENVDGLCGKERLECKAHAQCVVSKNGVGSCECNVGFYKNGLQCQDVDECLLDIHNCSSHAKCANTPGSYTCACSKGYEGDGKTCRINAVGSGEACTLDGRQCGANEECVERFCQCAAGFLSDGSICQDANECELGIHKCDANAFCVNKFGSFSCACNEGYLGDGFKCSFQEILEGCNGVKCHDNAECDRTGNIVVCVCKNGYQGDGLSCIDLDECNEGEEISNCHGNAFCHNTPGSYRCECSPGYKGDGVQCTAIDPCKDFECGANAECIVQEGSPVCQCFIGYYKDGKYCKDLDECNEGEEISNCHGNAFCHNTPGSYRCECSPGYKGDGVQCTAIDPCKDFECGPNAECVVQEGSPVCRCFIGYYKNGKYCKDYNECEAYRDACDKNARCVNTVGSYKCFCSPGYFGDGLFCKSDGTCSGSKCHWNAKCLEINGTRRCQCKSGFGGSGLVCSDLNECANSTLTCPKFSRCINTIGSYKCRCHSGYKWNEIECKFVCLRCFNGGTCTVTGCLCREGYSGDRCQWVGDDFLMFTQGSTIQRLSLPPRQDTIGELLETPRGPIVALDYDHTHKFIYFTDVAGKTIWRVKYNGTGAEKIITGGLSSPEGIAVDYIGGNIYWTDSMFDRIEVAKFNGSDRKVLFKTRLINPRSIVLNPEKGTMYWADWNRASPKIEVAEMDGGSRRMFIKQRIGLPNGLSIDRRNNELCWTDAKFGSISCANLDDGKPQVIYSSASYPFGLTSFGQYLIWTDWTARTIQQYDRQTFKLMPPIRRSTGSNGAFYDIKTVQRSLETGSHQCSENNGGCTNLCLPRPGGRSCACPNGFHLVKREDKMSISISGVEETTPGADTGSAFSGSGSGLGSGNQSIPVKPLSGTQLIPEDVCVSDSEYRILKNIP